MGTPIIAATALILYGIGLALQILLIRNRWTDSQRLILITGTLGLAAHLTLAGQFLMVDGGLDLSIFVSAVTISALMVALVIILALTRPVQNLLVATYPLAMATIIMKLAFHSQPQVVDAAAVGVLGHVVLAVAAYSFFALAALQALLVHIQHRQLKAHHNSGLVRSLPPLQTMESLLFGLIRAGVILLTLGIIAGAVFMEDIFSQQLAHKSLFTLFAWLVFTGLLIGRQVRGWRGAVASRWTLIGCLLLTVGYFGSRLVIDLLLQ